MLISKFDLYRKEWLDLVFANRNQQYGAYDLRRHYNDTLLSALGITFLGIVIILTITAVISHLHNSTGNVPQAVKVVNIDLSHKIYIMPQQKAMAKPKTAGAQPLRSAPIAVQKFIEPKAAPDAVAVDLPELDANVAVGPIDTKVPGSAAAQNIDPGTTTGTGNGDAGKSGQDVYDVVDQFEAMPEPIGGEAAWAKFLQKNLHYPKAAQEQNMQGKVYVSFIIERDGRLSDITVVRKVGFGFDEEALRVLKIAPAWKPGRQNGQAVRVRYVVPINFQLAE